MKRLTALAAVMLTLTAASVALGASAPGKFQTTLTGHGAKTMHGKLDGTWEIDLGSSSSGHIRLSVNGHPKGGGRYVISGTTITLTPKKGGACTTKAKYRLKLSGNTLTFRPIRDACAVRRDVLTYGPWTKTS